MIQKSDIIVRIKQLVWMTEPGAKVFLFGSYARDENKKDSDIDVLILLKKEKISYDDEIKIKYPLYELEFETGLVISPIVLSLFEWESRHYKTPFYENIKREGILL